MATMVSSKRFLRTSGFDNLWRALRSQLSRDNLVDPKLRFKFLCSTLLALSLLCSSCQKAAQDSPALESREALKVKTEKLQFAASGSRDLEFSGKLRANKSTQLSFLRGGRVESLLVNEGDRVSSGQTLGLLDTRSLRASQSELQAQLRTAQASSREVEAGPRRFEKAAALDQVQEIQANLALTETKLRRREKLFRDGAIPKENLDELLTQKTRLQNQLEAAQNRVRDLDSGARPESRQVGRARVAQARSTLASLQVQLDDSVLKAPYSGTIIERAVDEGTIVRSGQKVFQLLTSESLEAEVYLPPEKVSELQIGQSYELKAGEERFQAKLTEKLPRVDTSTGTQTVLLQPGLSATLKAGQLVRMTLPSEQHSDGYWLPSTALMPGERGLFTCYAVVSGAEPGFYKVEKHSVEILSTDGTRAFVRGTLAGSPELIVEGVQRVVPGQKVRKE